MNAKAYKRAPARCQRPTCEAPKGIVGIRTSAAWDGVIVETVSYGCGHSRIRDVSRVLSRQQLAAIERRHFGSVLV